MLTVPADTIAVVPYDDYYKGQHDRVFFNLRGHNKRDWFVRHAYFCLPLVMGNQHGFAMKSLFHATMVWNGGPTMDDTVVTIHNTEEQKKFGCLQSISSHFGLGIVTVQTAFSLRTPPNVSLVTIQPPNFFIDGLQNMTGVVEADNLRRDFTFNLKLTRPNYPVEIKPGDLLSAFLPYPRTFIDNFDLADAYKVFTPELIHEEQQAGRDMGLERETRDKANRDGVGRRYFEGEDVYGTPFQHVHQKLFRRKSESLPEVGCPHANAAKTWLPIDLAGQAEATKNPSTS